MARTEAEAVRNVQFSFLHNPMLSFYYQVLPLFLPVIAKSRQLDWVWNQPKDKLLSIPVKVFS